MKDEMIGHLQERLGALNEGKRLTWSLDDRAAVSRLLIEIQRMELKEKALVVIEHIAVNSDQEGGEIGLIYMATHAANDRCLHQHTDWKEWVEKFYEDLIARGEHKPISADENRKQLKQLSARAEALLSLPLPEET